MPARSCVLMIVLAAATLPSPGAAQSDGQSHGAIVERHIGVSRARAAHLPRSESDQALVEGWPLYRSERGQAAFNSVMATLKATDVKAPAASAFTGCAQLMCNASLPSIGADGWIPPGRLWLSPASYVLFAHSPKRTGGRPERRRPRRSMRYFVFHEFQNSSRNTDPYDTISSHNGSVFVPLYMSREGTDAKGRRFVAIIQVAPYDVVSIHASNKGSAGPGMEVAKNGSDDLQPLQALAGIVVGTIVKRAAPQVQVTNHRGAEGLAMLRTYEDHVARLRNGRQPAIVLPFEPAAAARVASASAPLQALIIRDGASQPLAIAERAFVPTARDRRIRSAMATPIPPRPVAATTFDDIPLVEPIRPAWPPGPVAAGPVVEALPIEMRQ